MARQNRQNGTIGSAIEAMIQQEVDRRVQEVLGKSAPKGRKVASPSRAAKRVGSEVVPLNPPVMAVATGPSTVTEKKEGKGRRRASNVEMEARNAKLQSIVSTLKAEGLDVTVEPTKAYTRVDMPVGNLAFRGRHVLVRGANVAPEHKAVTHLLDKASSAYFLSALAVAYIDDMTEEEVVEWTKGMAAKIKARLSA